MEITEILRIVVEVLIVGLTWYLKNKLKSTETELDLVVEDNVRLGQKLINAEKKWEAELSSYQKTVDNLKLKLEASTTILPELQKVVEDAVKVDKPKRSRKK